MVTTENYREWLEEFRREVDEEIARWRAAGASEDAASRLREIESQLAALQERERALSEEAQGLRRKVSSLEQANARLQALLALRGSGPGRPPSPPEDPRGEP